MRTGHAAAATATAAAMAVPAATAGVIAQPSAAAAQPLVTVAAAAAMVVAALPAPLTPQEQALKDLDLSLLACGVTDNPGRERLIKSQGLTNLGDIASLSQKDVGHLIEAFNLTCRGTTVDQKIGFMQIKKICALSYAVDKSIRINERFDVSNWDTGAINDARLEMNNLKSEDSSSEPDKIKIIDDKTIDDEYEEWYSHVVTTLGQMSAQSKHGLYLDYITRDTVTPLTISTDHDKMKYAAQLYGPAFERDNRKVWALIKRSAGNSKAFSYIQKFENAQDGRSALTELNRVFLGPDFVSKRIARVFQIVTLGTSKSVMYNGENSGLLTFISYAGTLIKHYAYIAKHRSPVDPYTQVSRLHEGIHGDARNKLAYAIEQVKDNHRADMDSAVTYLSGKVNDVYCTQSAKAVGGGGRRHVSEANQGRFHGRGGGRFGRPGRGGRGGRGRGNGDARHFDGRTEVSKINGHDTSDAKLQDNFPSDVFKGDLREYVMKRRRHLNKKGNNSNNYSSKRQIQEVLMEMLGDTKAKRGKQGDDDDSSSGEKIKSEKGGQAGSTFGKNARQR